MSTEDIFEKRRRELGLSTSGSGDLESAFQNRQMDLGLIPDTRPKKEKVQPKTQAQAHDFGNNAINNFDGKLPAASLLTAGTGGPSNASQIPGTSAYDKEQKRIDDSSAPTIVKSGASVLNKLGRDTALGKFITNLFPTDTQAIQRDSTGIKALDKIDDFAATYLTPALIPTGAPYGQGIIGSSYEAAGKTLSKGIGQSAVNAAASIIPKVRPDVAQNIARVGLTEGLAGAAQGAEFGLMQGQDSGQEILRNAGLGAAGGLVIGTGLAAGGAALNKLLKRTPEVPSNIEVLPPQQNNNVLALPEGRGTVRQSQAVGRSSLSPNTDPIINPTGWQPEPLGLPEANIGAPTTARRTTKPGLNSVLEQMKPIVDERTIPPTDHMNNLAKWIQTRIKDTFGQDVPLNEIRVLPYDDMKTVANEISSRINVEDTARQVARELGYDYDQLLSARSVDRSLITKARQTQNMRAAAGVDNLVKSSNDRYQPIVGRAPEPETVIARPGVTEVRASQGNIREPQTVSREQEIYNKVANGGHPTQEEIDFMLSDQFNHERILPDTTPSESTYVKPTKKTAEPFKVTEASTVVPGAGRNAPEPVAPSSAPTKTVPGERKFATTLKASEKTPKEFTEKLNSTYKPVSNQKSVDVANRKIAADADAAAKRILSIKKFDADSSATAQRLIDHFNKLGDYETSVDIADKIATEATKAGQFIQSLSIYNRLTPEGVLIHARRIANRVNETSSKLGRQAEVTPKMAEDIVSLAGVTQNMTGIKDLSNNVIDILEKAKSGEKLTSSEADTLSKFVNESKQFIKETTKPAKPPRAPVAPKDKRVRDNVASFLDAQEQAAKERLRAKGIRISSTPLDIWADYAVIGAAKMGKNIVKFADWSEQMVKDLGEGIRPQLSQLYESSKEAFNLTNKKISRQTISDAERLTQKIIKEKQLTGDEAESLLNIAQRVSALSGEAKRTASQDLQAILQSLDKPSFLRKIASAQTQAQLLNPKTQVRNVLGNELFYRLERINKYVSTPIDIARSKLTGSARTVTFRTNNQGKYWENWLKGGSAGARGVNINGLETQFDLASPAFTGKYNPLKYTEKALGASLRSFDNAAYSRAVNKSLGELATLDAINSGVKPTKEYVKNFIAKADDNVMQIADDYGKYVTFQDNNIISQGLTKFKRGLNLGKDFGFGDLVLKYPKTPGALLARALEYSPAGFIRSGWQVAQPLLRNGVEKNPAAVTQGLSRAIIGTFGLSGLGYFLIDNDILTGQASKDRDIRSLQSAAGKGQYQVNLSALERFVKSGFDPEESKIAEGDLLYNYDWMQPVSVAISLGANTNKALSGSGPKSNVFSGIAGTAYDAVSGSVNTLTEQSVLQGLARAAEGTPNQTTMDKVADILSDIPASFIPTIFNQVKQLSDNTKRETTDPTLLEQSLNKAQAKIPGIASKLPKKFDTLGNEQKHYQDNSIANIFFNPGFPSRYKLSDEARMIVDLIAETGDEGVAPRVPNKKLDGTPLTGEEFSRLSQKQGEFTKLSLSKVKESLSDQSKAKSVKKKLTDSGSKARKDLIKTFPRLNQNKD